MKRSTLLFMQQMKNIQVIDGALNWRSRISKAQAHGIHGTYVVGLEHKKAYYPTRRDEEAVNPDGTRLR